MSRHRHGFIALAILPVFLAPLVLWVRSYWIADELPLGRQGWALISRGGRIGYTNWPAYTASLDRRRAAEDHYYRQKRHTLLTGETFPAPTTLPAIIKPQGFGVDYSLLTLPVGGLSLAFYLLHCRAQYVRRRRISAGLCPSCGYDLRATTKDPQLGGPLLPRCPECGHEARRPPL